MKLPLQVSFKNLERNEQITELLKEQSKRLNRLGSDIIQCHVTVMVPHRGQRPGNFYEVHIEVTMRGGSRLYANHASKLDVASADMLHTINETFESVYRQIEDHSSLGIAA